MKILKKVKGIEVKRAFVVADFVSAKKDMRKHLGFVSKDLFIGKLKNAKKKVNKLKEFQLDKIIKSEYKKRLVAYDNSKWFIGEVKINEVGVWKKAGGLPLPWTNTSLFETAKKVKYALKNNSKILKKRSRYSIPNMLKTNVHLLQKEKYLFPIIFESGTGTRGRRGLKKQTKYDIDDGCMRSVALAVSGLKIIKVYIGLPKKD
ncbi:MAG: hypothetical protein WCP17_02650 [bacterium]